MPTIASIDKLFTQATESKAMPGIVAVAATDKGTIYEGAFGKRELGKDAPMTVDSVVWIASMTKAITATAAMQLVERGQLSLERPASEVVTSLSAAKVLEGFDAAGQPRLRAPKRPITLQPPSDAHRRFRLRDLAAGDRAVPERDRHAGHHDVRQRRADDAAPVRSGRPLGVRDQHRLGRQDGRDGERPEARPLFPGQHPRPARHEGHFVQGLAVPAGSARERAPARREGRARADRVRAAGGTRVPHGRRRPLRHRTRLSGVHADDHAGRQPGRRAGPAPRHGRPHGTEPHRVARHSPPSRPRRRRCPTTSTCSRGCGRVGG